MPQRKFDGANIRKGYNYWGVVQFIKTDYKGSSNVSRRTICITFTILSITFGSSLKLATSSSFSLIFGRCYQQKIKPN